MKFARSPIPSLAELKKMQSRAFFDGMASAFDMTPSDLPPINLGIPAKEALRADYWAIANDFRRTLGWKPIEGPAVRSQIRPAYTSQWMVSFIALTGLGVAFYALSLEFRLAAGVIGVAALGLGASLLDQSVVFLRVRRAAAALWARMSK